MGAWGSGGFENDAALDWAGSVQSMDDVAVPFERMKAQVDEGAGAYVDADLASELVAAAETVAMLMGRPGPDFPQDLRERLADAAEPDDLLYHRARHAVLNVLRQSELAELWEEEAAEGGVNEWQSAISGLVDRLNPDLGSEPWEPEEIEQNAGGPVGQCAFCDQPIRPGELFGLNVHDYSDRASFTRGFGCHLACLNARLHHKFAIVDLKFDPGRMPDLDKL